MPLHWLYDRYWSYCQWGRNQDAQQNNAYAKDTWARSFVRVTGWRVLNAPVGFVTAYAVTGNIHSALSISALKISTKLPISFLIERAWTGTNWGMVATEITAHPQTPLSYAPSQKAPMSQLRKWSLAALGIRHISM